MSPAIAWVLVQRPERCVLKDQRLDIYGKRHTTCTLFNRLLSKANLHFPDFCYVFIDNILRQTVVRFIPFPQKLRKKDCLSCLLRRKREHGTANKEISDGVKVVRAVSIVIELDTVWSMT